MTRLSCQFCARPITRHPYARPRRGDTLKFCSLRCAAIGRRLIGEDEIARIVAARRANVSWLAIGREIGACASTLQRALKRAGLQVELPPWVLREPQRSSP